MSDTPLSDLPDMLVNVPYEDLRVGQTAEQFRTLGRDDIAAFAAISGDVNPAHLDPAYAETTRFHGVIAHGMWGAALISRLLGTRLPGPGTIYLGQTLRFLRPVRVGDTLRVQACVLSKEDDKRRVELQCDIRNQTGALVLDGIASVIAPATRVSLPRTHLPQLYLFDSAARFAALLAHAAGLAPLRCAVVHPCDGMALAGALDAAARGLIIPVLVAPAARLAAVAAACGRSLDGAEIVDVAHSSAAAERACAMAAAGEVALLMQGSLPLDELLQAVAATAALRTGRLLSHIYHLDTPVCDRPLLLSDAVLNLRPGLDDKAAIIRNTIELAHALGMEEPRLAILAAQDAVTPRLASTIDAAALCKMAQRQQIQGALLDGPLTLASAIAPAAARRHGLPQPVAGQADILIAPDMESGSMLAGQLECLAGACGCGLVAGAAVPIALNHGSDGKEARIAAAALALVLAHHQRGQRLTVS